MVVQKKVDIVEPFFQVPAVFVQDRPESFRDGVFERIREAVQIVIETARRIFITRVERGQIENGCAAAAEGEDAEPKKKVQTKPSLRRSRRSKSSFGAIS